MSAPLRVLLIEDSENDVFLILRQLRRGGYEPEFQRVETAEALHAALTAQSWDVILCDYSLPQFSAPEAFQVLRERAIDVPIIIVSGTIGEERAVECILAGAHDFILKDRPARLGLAVQRVLAEAARRAEQARIREQLDHAERALARSEKLRALGQMAAGISHDLKNILNPLAMRLQMLERHIKRDAKDKIESSLTEMHQIIHTGVQTIDRIRSFSRQTPESLPESVDLNVVAKEAIELARPRMSTNKCVLSYFHIELGMPPRIHGHPGELVLALVNLMVNSIDAMPGGGNITVRTGAERDGALVQVSDDGPGMSAEVEKHIFEPFFTTKGESGTGLGLAMVYGTVLRHEGTVSLSTAPGRGATFSLWFPGAQGRTA